MKTIFFFLLIIAFSPVAMRAQFRVSYDPSVQSTTAMQYFAPKGSNLFVGDCIPFSHNGTYYLYWLLDSAHHAALNGLGGHQWAVSTTTDLKTWKHYPVVIGIDEQWEKSICTGSVVYHDKKFYAFYATRLLVDGKVNEQLSYAISDDGIHFKKQKPNPFYTSAPGYSKRDFRDPKVFIDKDGMFHLFVSSRLDKAPIQKFSGSLVHMTSKDLKTWRIEPPVLSGQRSVPECPDYFKWNDWYYLIYGHDGDTYYVKSRSPYGPWEQPEYQTLVEDWMNVAKTAEFKNNRRIVAGWIPSRRNNTDDSNEAFGGNVVLRELIQTENGTLATRFPDEVAPAASSFLKFDMVNDSLSKKLSENSVMMNGPNGVAAMRIDKLPSNARISFQVDPTGLNEEFGLLLRSNPDGTKGYKLSFSATDQIVELHDAKIFSVEGLDKKINVEIILKGDIIDVEINDRRCIVNRLVEEKGASLWFFVKHGKLQINDIKIQPLTESL